MISEHMAKSKSNGTNMMNPMSIAMTPTDATQILASPTDRLRVVNQNAAERPNE